MEHRETMLARSRAFTGQPSSKQSAEPAQSNSSAFLSPRARSRTITATIAATAFPDRPTDQQRRKTIGYHESDVGDAVNVRGLAQQWAGDDLGVPRSHDAPRICRAEKSTNLRTRYMNVQREGSVKKTESPPKLESTLGTDSPRSSRPVSRSLGRHLYENTPSLPRRHDSGEEDDRKRLARVRFWELEGAQSPSSKQSREPRSPAVTDEASATEQTVRRDVGSVKRMVEQIQRRELDVRAREEALRVREGEARKVQMGPRIRLVQLGYQERVMMLEQRYMSWKQESIARQRERAMEEERKKFERERLRWEAERVARREVQIREANEERRRKKVEWVRLQKEIGQLTMRVEEEEKRLLDLEEARRRSVKQKRVSIRVGKSGEERKAETVVMMK